MNTPAPLRRRLAPQIAALALPLFAVPVWGQFSQTGAGPYDYSNTANWTGGTITNNFSSSPVANQVVTFGADYTTVDPDGAGSASASLTISNTGTFSRTFIGSGGDRTLTLGGNITLGSTGNSNTNTVVFGSVTDGQKLNISLGGVSRTLSVGTNRTLEVLNVVSGANSLTKTGAGKLVLHADNTYTGGTNFGASGVIGGIIEASSLKNGGVASSIGASSNANTNLIFGGTTTAGILRYTGAGDSTDRRFQMGGVGATIESSGTGALHFTNSGSPTYSTGSSPGVLTLGGTNTDGNSFAAVVGNPSSSTTSLTKTGVGRWILTGASTYTGNTILDAGTLELGAANRISNSSNLVLNGGTFATGGFGETLATLDLNGNATIDFGSGDSDLVFSDSSGVAWGTSISLSLINFTEGVDTLRFGTSASGLTITQLGQITINGLAATIDSSGFLSAAAIPEPSSFALAAGAGGLLLAGARRRRVA